MEKPDRINGFAIYLFGLLQGLTIGFVVAVLAGVLG